jgi:hypothetical protein
VTFIPSYEALRKFTDILSRYLVIFSSIAASLGILKFVLQLLGLDLMFLDPGAVPLGTSLNRDYNFGSLLCFIGLFSLFYNRKKYSKKIFFFIIILFVLNILFSFSRRGLSLLILFWLLLIIFGFGGDKSPKLILKRIGLNILVCILFFASTAIFIGYNRTHPDTVKYSFDQKGEDGFQIKNIITQMFYRYFTIFNYNRSLDEFYFTIWNNDGPVTQDFNYDILNKGKDDKNLIYNGDFSYGLKFWSPEANKTKHELIATPFGSGIRITRKDGDNGAWPLSYTGRDIIFYSLHRYDLTFKYKVIKGKEIPFNIGFGTVDDASGFSPSSSLSLNINNLSEGWKNVECSYTFARSHYGVKLFLNSLNDSTIIDVADVKLTESARKDSLPRFKDELAVRGIDIERYLYVVDSTNYSYFGNKKTANLFDNSDFEYGTLFWIAYADATKLSIIDTPFGKGIKISRFDGNGGDWSLRYFGDPIIYYPDHTYQISFIFKVEKGESIPFNVGWWVDEGSGFGQAVSLPLSIASLSNGWRKATCSYKFRLKHVDLPTFLNSLKDSSTVAITNISLVDLNRDPSLPAKIKFTEKKDSLPTIIDSETKEDLNKFTNKLYSARTNRLTYSWIVFRDSLSSRNKIIGGGFRYLSYFMFTFNEPTYDYPHNPIVSSFLYSGIIGGLTYLLFLIIGLYYYFKYWKYHSFFFWIYIIGFYYGFVSANTHFSTQIIAIFSLIPFLTKYVSDNERSSLSP